MKKAQPNLIVAKFDATVNDVPKEFAVEGFPTIYFVPSGKKASPLVFFSASTRCLEFI